MAAAIGEGNAVAIVIVEVEWRGVVVVKECECRVSRRLN